jgi:hypothetical protein
MIAEKRSGARAVKPSTRARKSWVLALFPAK